jgi:TPR repeat protein
MRSPGCPVRFIRTVGLAVASPWLAQRAIVGDAHAFGRGIAQDYVEALKWATLAVGQSLDVQKLRARWRDEFAQKMTPAQIAEAEMRAAQGFCTG